MASSEGRANGGRDGNVRDGLLPPWLTAFLHATYFEPCCSYRNNSQLFCTDCVSDPICRYCVRIDHKGHSVIQVKKYICYEVVRVSEIQEFIDISGIQTFKFFKEDVVLLNERPQTIPKTKLINDCEFCRKTIVIPFRFCSIGCKLGVSKRGDTNLSYKNEETMKRGDTNLSRKSQETENPSSETESVISSTPVKFQKTRHSGSPRLRVPVSDEKATEGCNIYFDDADAGPSTKPVFNHSNSQRRKGRARRAHFF